MKTSYKGIALIKEFEGLKLDAYQCSAGVWTIGFGTTKYPNGEKVKNGDKLSGLKQANDYLHHDLIQYEQAVDRLVQVPLTQNQYDALVSFVYNLGAGSLAKSTLLKKLNAGDYAGASKEFKKWIYATDPKTGKRIKLTGLIARRKREAELFMSNNNPTTFRRIHEPDPNNTPIPVATLPLPTAQQQGYEPQVKQSNPTVVTVGAGSAIAGSVAIVEYLPYITDILHVVRDLDWRVVVTTVSILAIVGFIWWRRR
jgi:GH24 family phage-related lysozyme (muramidase)